MPDPDDIPYVSTVKRLTNINEIGDVPVIGGLYGAGNTVIDFYESECRPDWTVYVETLFPALGQVVLVLLTFGLDDVLRGYFRPAGGRGFGGLGRSSRRGKKISKAQRARGLLKGGIPEIGDEVGRRLPGAKTIKARNVGNAERFLWKVDGLAQRGLFWWMVADLADDFAVNWTTGLYSSTECAGNAVGGVEWYSATELIAHTNTYNAILLNEKRDEYGPLTSNNFSVNIPAGFEGFLSYFATFGPYTSPPGDIELIIRNRTNGAIIARSGPNHATTPEGQRELGVSARLIGGFRYEWGYRNTGPIAVLHEPTVTVMIRAR